MENVPSRDEEGHRISPAIEQSQHDPEKNTVSNGETPTVFNIDAKAEKRLLRKMDFHIIPLVVAMYLLSFLDRSNIGNANTAGLSKDLKLNNGQYTWLLTIFYISYIVFEFQALAWKIVPPHIWAAFCVLGWGIMSTLMAVVKNWSGAMALRFFLGVFEAGYGPGIPYLLSFFYMRRELGSRVGFFLAAAPLANSFSGALAYGITSNKHLAIASWRVLFLVEGLPTIAMVPIIYFFLPDNPSKIHFLTPEEKEMASTRAIRQVGKTERIGKPNFKDIGATLLDAKAWLTALMYFSCNVSFASLPVFLPTILNNMGFTAVNAQGLTAPPFFLSFLVTLLTTWLADKTQQRGLMIMFLTIMGGAGYLMLAIAKTVGVRYAGVFLAASGIFPAIANILPWTLNNQGNDTRRGMAIVILNSVGQIGPILGTRLYPSNEAPYFKKGQSVCAAFMFFTTLLVLVLRTLLWWENKKLDRQYGTVEEQLRGPSVESAGEGEGEVSKQAGVENYGPMFRYVL